VGKENLRNAAWLRMGVTALAMKTTRSAGKHYLDQLDLNR
jgi:hypothetical protein